MGNQHVGAIIFQNINFLLSLHIEIFRIITFDRLAIHRYKMNEKGITSYEIKIIHSYQCKLCLPETRKIN